MTYEELSKKALAMETETDHQAIVTDILCKSFGQEAEQEQLVPGVE